MRQAQRCLIVLAVAGLVACGGSSSDSVPQSASVSGTLSLSLVDAPVENVSEVWIELNGISVRGGPDDEQIDIDYATPRSVDLLTLVDGASEALLVGEELPSGSYSEVRLLISAEFDGIIDSYVVTDQGEQFEIRVPSGTQSGLKLIDDIVITDNEDSSFTLDWDVRQGLVNPPGQPGYLLKPTIRVIDDTGIAQVTGTVANALVEDPSCNNDLVKGTGNAIYIFNGLDATVTDIGADDSVLTATTTVKQDTAGDYVYSAVLTPGDYTMAFTCQSSLDNPDTDESLLIPPGTTIPAPIVFSDGINVSISADERAVVDFE